MIEPIVLNEFREELEALWNADENCTLGYAPYAPELGNGDRMIGKFRGEPVYIGSASPTHRAIYCPPQALRMHIPRSATVNTYGELRQWCAEQIANEAAQAHNMARVITENLPFGPLPNDEQPLPSKSALEQMQEAIRASRIARE